MSTLSVSNGSVLDIGGGNIDLYLQTSIHSCLVEAHKKGQTPYLPEELLYLGKGLDLWKKLVFHPKYYQTHDEMELFLENGEKIIAYIPPNCTLIDLGSGNTEKVEVLLSALEKRRAPALYLALDINREYLKRNLASLSQKYTNVVCQGVFGTYDDAFAWCKTLPSPRMFLWLGSTLFRGTRDEALASLKSWTGILRPDDVMLVGADGHSAPKYHDKIWESYHADEDAWQALWDNGFQIANRVVGETWFRSADWKLDAVIDTEPVVRHRSRFLAQRDVVLGTSGIKFNRGDEFVWLEPHKFNRSSVHELCALAGLQVDETWQSKDSEMYQYLIRLATPPDG